MPSTARRSAWDNLLACFGLRRGPAQGRRSPRDTGPRSPKKLSRFRRWCQKKLGRKPSNSASSSASSSTPDLPEIPPSHAGEDLEVESVSSEELSKLDTPRNASRGTYTVAVHPGPKSPKSQEKMTKIVEDYYEWIDKNDVDLFYKEAPFPGLLDEENFKILHQLGSGAFGSVFLGSELSSGNLVAIKFLNKLESQEHEDLLYEGLVLYSMNEAVTRTNIAPRFVGLLPIKEDQRPVSTHDIALVTDFVGDVSRGVSITLAQELRKVPRVAEPESVCEWAWVMFQVASKMARLHSLGVIHNDLKEDNILLSGRIGTYPSPYINDFGNISYVSDPDKPYRFDVPDPKERLERMTKSIHLAPEVYWNIKSTTASDVYSFGIILQRYGLADLMGIEDFVTRCCYLYPSERPTMKEAAEVLLSVMTNAQRELTGRSTSAIV